MLVLIPRVISFHAVVVLIALFSFIQIDFGHAVVMQQSVVIL